MGKLKALIPFMLAVVVALISAGLIYNWIQKKTSVPVVSKTVPEDKAQMTLAVTDLPWGTKLTTEMVKAVGVPKDYAPSGAFSNPSDLVGRVLVMPVKQNEPVLESKLAPREVAQGGVSAVVSQGKRAIAVAGDKVIGLAGFIQPGNIVDILVTIKDPQNDKLHYTKTVLENIRVLATGTQIENKSDGKPAPVDVFTVEVSPEESERLSLAAVQGKLHFALRNVMDSDVIYTVGATVADAMDSYRPRLQLASEPAAKMEPKIDVETRRSFKMLVINGKTAIQVSF